MFSAEVVDLFYIYSISGSRTFFKLIDLNC